MGPCGDFSKYSAEKYHDQTIKFTPPAVGLPPFRPWVCLHHTFALGNLIVRCLTGSHMIISSKSNYRARLNVNMDTADSISLHFNFGKGYYFVLWVKRQIFDKARFFKMNNINSAMDYWRENDGNLLTPFAIIWKLSRQNIIRKITSFPFYSSDELARWFLSDECKSHFFTETWFGL